MQCDIDVVDTREVPLHFDVEIPAIMNQALHQSMPAQYSLKLTIEKYWKAIIQA